MLFLSLREYAIFVFERVCYFCLCLREYAIFVYAIFVFV